MTLVRKMKLDEVGTSIICLVAHGLYVEKLMQSILLAFNSFFINFTRPLEQG